MQAAPKLIYFDARGVIEPTRLLLAAAGVQYEDKRYKVDMTAKPPVWCLPSIVAHTHARARVCAHAAVACVGLRRPLATRGFLRALARASWQLLYSCMQSAPEFNSAKESGALAVNMGYANLDPSRVCLACAWRMALAVCSPCSSYIWCRGARAGVRLSSR